MKNIKPKWLILTLLLATISILTSCSDREPIDEVSVEQAENILNTIVEYAESQDMEGLCSFGASTVMTERQLTDAGGWKSLPEDAPVITDTWLIEEKVFESHTSLGGRVLVLEGTTGNDTPYRTEFLVTLDSGTQELIVQYPVYWSGISIAAPDDEGKTTTSIYR